MDFVRKDPELWERVMSGNRNVTSSMEIQKGRPADKKERGEPNSTLGAFVGRLWKERALTDVLVVADGVEFRAHKAVLACHSPYFSEALVKPGFSDVHYVQVPGIGARAFELLLQHMYTGKLEVGCQELCDVYRAARRLGMQGAIRSCLKLLQVTPRKLENAVHLWVCARRLGLLDSERRAFRLACLHLERLVNKKEFLDLNAEQIGELLSADEMGARSEITVFLAALRWLDYDFMDRECSVASVMGCVRFPLMTIHEVLACYHPPLLPGIVLVPQVRLSLLNATCYIASKSDAQEDLFSEMSSKPRTFLFSSEPMVLWDVRAFDPKESEPLRRSRAATVIQSAVRGYFIRKLYLEEKVVANYAAAVIQAAYRGHRVRKSIQLFEQGESFDRILEPQKSSTAYALAACNARPEGVKPNVILRLDPKAFKWEIFARSPVPLHDARVVNCQEELYLIGGYALNGSDAKGPLPDCYVWEDGAWEEIESLQYARAMHAALELDGLLVVIGGRDDSRRVLASVEKLENGYWGNGLDLPEPRMAMGACVWKGNLWIAGGVGPGGIISDKVFWLDRRAKKWREQARLPKPLAFPSLLAYGSRMLCVGGVGAEDGHLLESSECAYALEGNKWKPIQPLPLHVHSALLRTIDGDVMLFGGFNTLDMRPVTTSLRLQRDGKWTTAKGPSMPRDVSTFLVAITT